MTFGEFAGGKGVTEMWMLAGLGDSDVLLGGEAGP